MFPLVISAPEEIRTPNLLIRRHLRWLGVGIGIDLLSWPYTHTRLHRDSSSGIGQATMVVGNNDDASSSVGDLGEATATGDSLAIKGRSDRDSEFGE